MPGAARLASQASYPSSGFRRAGGASRPVIPPSEGLGTELCSTSGGPSTPQPDGRSPAPPWPKRARGGPHPQEVGLRTPLCVTKFEAITTFFSPIRCTVAGTNKIARICASWGHFSRTTAPGKALMGAELRRNASHAPGTHPHPPQVRGGGVCGTVGLRPPAVYIREPVENRPLRLEYDAKMALGSALAVKYIYAAKAEPKRVGDGWLNFLAL